MGDSIIWEVGDYCGRSVSLSTAVWGHIAENHRLSTDFVDIIKGTIISPEMVVQSEKYPDTEIHSRFDISGGILANRWFHVPVSYQIGIGIVLSAYDAPKPKLGKIVYINKKL